MHKLVSIKNLSFAYPDQPDKVLDNINLTIYPGDFLMIAGNTGSGKTTLLNHLKKELMPLGNRQGQILINDTPIDNLSKLESAQTVGYVAQDPQLQPVMSKAIDELAFPLENIGCPSNEIERRITELTNFLALDQSLNRAINELSGGQLQLVNLASVLILRPKLILLDEPTSQLDPLTAQTFLNVLSRIQQELGITIVITEHRLSTISGLANRMILLQDHTISFDGSPTKGIEKMFQDERLRYFIPSIPKLFLTNHIPISTLPISVSQGQAAIQTDHLKFTAAKPKQSLLSETSKPLLQAKNISFTFDQTRNVIDHLNLTVNRGDWLSIIGKNGSGKSTLLSLLIGLTTPQHGKIRFENQLVWKLKTVDRIKKISFLSQTPSLQFTADSVRQELVVQADQLQLSDPASAIKRVTKQFNLTKILDHNPFDISGGQQQLLGLAIALMATPDLLILDEATKGLDPYTKVFIGKILKQYQQDGVTIVMASHDMEFCAEFSDHCAFMFDGHLNTLLSTTAFFANNFFFTTPINRIVHDQVPSALLFDDINLASEGR
ncbi:ABC transporter ATP-binding protein [Lentilactobacillus kisonensis]|uniref:ABC transporter, ATP-binding protein n=2 Tax=Lentilactobacillus kisonensis TaxID=481722 RepID=H1LI59_9LACO|nr:ATP-binding cassette domain-containing protein [Lentilactobacillus kisonensis]EHO49892.1 ABC transporter, ATP-binding protein [Lentilactobacillus kisonensis F0435]KRL22145.1 ABC transporter, ATP-binding protein [Lentilactobacillus kisonensis DSM 19906 = JCM 15041]